MIRFDHVVLHVAADSVLWTEERTQIDIRMVVQQVRSVTIRVIDGRLITDQTDTRATQVRGNDAQRVPVAPPEPR